MSTIRLKDKYFEPYLSHEEIQERIAAIAGEINRDFSDKQPLFLAVLNGAFMFAADLFKNINIDCEISFIKLASYHGTRSSGNVISLIGLDENLSSRNVIILEDIIDTGRTLHEFIPQLQRQNPASIKIASLLVKPNAAEFDVKADYKGFEIPNDFIVGYGLDYDGFGRNLKDIYKITGQP